MIVVRELVLETVVSGAEGLWDERGRDSDGKGTSRGVSKEACLLVKLGWRGGRDGLLESWVSEVRGSNDVSR